MKNSVKCVIVSALVFMVSFGALAKNLPDLRTKSEAAAAVLREIVQTPDRGIPESLLSQATCIATIPNVIRAGFIFGARFGRGLVSCRVLGQWSNPSYVTLAGGSWGLQIGAESIDLILVFVRPNAAEKFTRNNITLGADASVAAGPVGRDAQAGTDYQLNSEIYSYSRSRGLFAGLTLEGSSLSVDRDANALAYGPTIDARDLLYRSTMTSPKAVTPYLQALRMYVH